MLLDPASAETYRVREVAPDILLLANLGAVQARDAGPARVAQLASEIGADALCIHLNPAQELVQDEGDRDFRGCVDAIGELTARLPLPVIVKETGCGLSPRTLERLVGAGVTWVDIAGAGGTTWTGVEALRGSKRQRALGSALREWGIPTAASLIFARRSGLNTIASGGIRDENDIVRALALGADLTGLALPFLRAWSRGGTAGVMEAGQALTEGLRALMILTGARNLGALREIPRIIGPALQGWTEPCGLRPAAGSLTD
jgi:isopentenyl-diphosphate delta-isomerase